MTVAVHGGAMRRYLRQLSATMVLGFLFVGVILFRLSFAQPLMALALAVGIVSMSACATCLGKVSNTSKTFMSLYLFTPYIATQVDKVPMLDIFGFNGVATSAQVFMQLELAAAAIGIGYFYTRWKNA